MLLISDITNILVIKLAIIDHMKVCHSTDALGRTAEEDSIHHRRISETKMTVY